jgi:hypothetical protein
MLPTMQRFHVEGRQIRRHTDDWTSAFNIDEVSECAAFFSFFKITLATLGTFKCPELASPVARPP